MAKFHHGVPLKASLDCMFGLMTGAILYHASSVDYILKGSILSLRISTACGTCPYVPMLLV
jgi:hypothetical protein